MEDFVLVHHEIPRRKLQSGYSAAAGFGDGNPRWHFPGNFWWTTSDHASKLPDIAGLNRHDRWDAETWIGMNGADDFYWHNYGDSIFPSFRIVTSEVAAGRVSTSGYHGWIPSRVVASKDWTYDHLISAHGPSLLVVEVHRPIQVFGFASGTSEPRDWTATFEIGSDVLGTVSETLQRTQSARLSPGTYRLRIRISAGEHWGAHTCWGVIAEESEPVCDDGPRNPAEIPTRPTKPDLSHRTSIISFIALACRFDDYLEIGLGDGRNFASIPCTTKVSVDPDAMARPTFEMTSDDFFSRNTTSFDLIFIDGFHHADQVARDLRNALESLRPDGVIVCHDLNPATEEMQRVPRCQDEWTGDGWKAWIDLRRERPDLAMIVIDADYGVGVILKGSPAPPIQISDFHDLDWQYFVKHREKLLNLLSPDKAFLFLNSQFTARVGPFLAHSSAGPVWT